MRVARLRNLRECKSDGLGVSCAYPSSSADFRADALRSDLNNMCNVWKGIRFTAILRGCYELAWKTGACVYTAHRLAH